MEPEGVRNMHTRRKAPQKGSEGLYREAVSGDYVKGSSSMSI